jgi:hypothetical protein
MAIVNGYTDLASVKAALRIDDNDDDTLIERAIEAASRRIDDETGRRFYVDATTSARVYIPKSNELVIVNDISTVTGLVVKIDSAGDSTFATTLNASDFQVEPLNSLVDGEPIVMIRTFSDMPIDNRGRASVQVTAKWGWPSIPNTIREACVLLASRHFKRLDSPLGVAGFGDMGAIMVRRLDPDVAALLQAKKRMTVA